MGKYRKRLTVIEAEQWDPMKIGQAMPRGVHQEAHGNSAYITTAGGAVALEPGDWICRQVVRGREDVWPVKPDIFAATYVPANCSCYPERGITCWPCINADRDINAAPSEEVSESASQAAWLIERGQSHGCTPPIWLRRTGGGDSFEWTHVAWLATRFSKEEALAEIERRSFLRKGSFGDAVEHSFIRRTPNAEEVSERPDLVGIRCGCDAPATQWVGREAKIAMCDKHAAEWEAIQRPPILVPPHIPGDVTSHIEMTKEWCEMMAKEEGDHEISVGGAAIDMGWPIGATEESSHCREGMDGCGCGDPFDGDAKAIVGATKEGEPRELLPCPFCGASVEIEEYDAGLHYFRIVPSGNCFFCDMLATVRNGLPLRAWSSRKSIIARWNRRARTPTEPRSDDDLSEIADIIHAECFVSPDNDSRCERAAGRIYTRFGRVAEPDAGLVEQCWDAVQGVEDYCESLSPWVAIPVPLLSAVVDRLRRAASALSRTPEPDSRRSDADASRV